MTTYAYLRISTDHQDVISQKHRIQMYAQTLGLPVDDWVEDTDSGTAAWHRRGLGAMVERAQPGDTLLVAELSHLSRKLLEILSIGEIVLKKKVNLIIIKESFKFDASLQSKMAMVAFGMVADIERTLISIRTKQGLARRRAKGKPLGRQRGMAPTMRRLDIMRGQIMEWQAKGLNKTAIAKLLGVARTTYDRWLAHQTPRPPHASEPVTAPAKTIKQRRRQVA